MSLVNKKKEIKLSKERLEQERLEKLEKIKIKVQVEKDPSRLLQMTRGLELRWESNKKPSEEEKIKTKFTPALLPRR